ncbi:ABC transporter substrate-binding protein [Altererythrobacter sp. BO-6]|uniref:ABC transporter substrate-binding protein n=1 Tax=Altererythrobacter sp. BO-6 TaxID=2604537 RepID=UPI0013E1210A|nr:ABC transporter substrate-binding protein [Altererythrobacter sp. BO-6]QIG55156.1 ABC transporter substrate-binding protein [Altererythrobacter sp. BO-6]
MGSKCTTARIGIGRPGKLARALLAAASLALAGCAAAPERDDSAEAEFPRIVSLNPCIDAVLVELAAPDQLLAISHYSRDPAASSIPAGVAARYRTTGGTVEEVLALDPDLVLASSFLPPATRTALEDLGVEVATFGIAATPDASIAQLREIARLAGREASGEALVAEIKAALAVTGAYPDEPALSAVLWQPGQIVPGEATLVSALMRHTGFASQSAALGMGQADYLSLEQVLANPPDVLLVAGDAPAQRHPALQQLHGTRIASFDPSLIYCGGPSMIRAAERLAAIRDSAT